MTFSLPVTCKYACALLVKYAEYSVDLLKLSDFSHFFKNNYEL